MTFPVLQSYTISSNTPNLAANQPKNKNPSKGGYNRISSFQENPVARVEIRHVEVFSWPEEGNLGPIFDNVSNWQVVARYSECGAESSSYHH
jgi:hypothetical protein